jgi:hypothetical protein
MAGARRGGGITRRCECRGGDGKRLGAKCPDLTKRKHGRYEIHQELPDDAAGKRRRFRRTGYTDKTAAETDLGHIRAILDLATDDNERCRVGVHGRVPGAQPRPLAVRRLCSLGRVRPRLQRAP